MIYLYTNYILVHKYSLKFYRDWAPADYASKLNTYVTKSIKHILPAVFVKVFTKVRKINTKRSVHVYSNRTVTIAEIPNTTL